LRRFIEETFPVKEVSEHSVREKNIRHGHISTLHVWWARRPLAASRATAYAALIPSCSTDKEKEEKRRFIVELSKWENSLNKELIERARRDILDFYGRPPRVLDCFAGGGSIPLEALRLGCEAHAVEYNPVAALILKCILEYPQKYGKKLKEDVERWGNWVFERAKEEIGRFYPDEVVETNEIELEGGKRREELETIGYIWARTIPCQNPSCGAEIPLMRQFWLVKKEKRKVSLYPYVEGKEVKFRIVGNGYEEMPEGFDPSKGTVKGAIATCPVCGFVCDANTTRKLFQQGKAGQRMVAVVLHGKNGKTYRIATEKDVEVYREAEKYLEVKRVKLMEEWGLDPVPDEPMPPKETLGFRVQRYGMLKWGDLFNSRQKLALITFTEKVRLAYRKMVEGGYDKEYAKAVASYLGLALDMAAAFSNTLARWENTSEAIKQLYSRQALPMLWDYIEANLFSGSSGSWNAGYEYYLKVLLYLSEIPPIPNSNPESSIPKVFQCSATELPYPKEYFDAVLTDPPYYDNVPYSYLSDFFYVWLKRIIGDLYPDLFSTPLTPKSKEIVAYSHAGGSDKGKRYFEEMLKKAFKEISRVLKPDGIAVIVYTHKSTSGWETLINSLLDSGLVTTASWPIDTEMRKRLRALESAALASSIYIVCRKMNREKTGWFNEVKEEIRQRLHAKLDKLWNEGISGADFFIAAIGSAIEVFGKYEKVMDYEGNIIRAEKLLEFVREVVTDYAVRQILHDGIAGELSPLTRFYLLWRWTYGEAKVEFDEARKLAQSVGLNLEKHYNRGFIKKEKEFIIVLGPHERKLEEIGDEEMIDVLHKSALLWKAGRREELKKLLSRTYGISENFYRLAQAISETLPNESKEKKLLDGFLSERSRIVDEIRSSGVQRRLFE
jgi:adenine-specific DNA methylase